MQSFHVEVDDVLGRVLYPYVGWWYRGRGRGGRGVGFGGCGGSGSCYGDGGEVMQASRIPYQTVGVPSPAVNMKAWQQGGGVRHIRSSSSGLCLTFLLEKIANRTFLRVVVVVTIILVSFNVNLLLLILILITILILVTILILILIIGGNRGWGYQ